MSMSRYRSETDNGATPGRSYSVRTSELSGAFDPSLAPPYPNLEDELRKDVAILRSSLDIRDNYIEELRKTRDSLQTELDLKEAYIGSLKDSLKGYEASFRKARINAMLRKDNDDFSD